MADDSAPLTPQQMSRFMEQIKEPFNKTEEHRRRAIEVSAGFFEKIAALSAASTAVLASLILAIANKSDIHKRPAKTLVHDLLCIAFILGARSPHGCDGDWAQFDGGFCRRIYSGDAVPVQTLAERALAMSDKSPMRSSKVWAGKIL
jgi:hypothetical protein